MKIPFAAFFLLTAVLHAGILFAQTPEPRRASTAKSSPEELLERQKEMDRKLQEILENQERILEELERIRQRI